VSKNLELLASLASALKILIPPLHMQSKQLINTESVNTARVDTAELRLLNTTRQKKEETEILTHKTLGSGSRT
jgi:hypothetical protein